MRGSLVNRLLESHEAEAEPEVGFPATITHYSDRSPATVAKVVRAKTGQRAGKVREIHVREDAWKVISGSTYDGSAQYEYTEDPDAPITVYRHTKKGWRSAAGDGLTLGVRERYHDPHF